MEDPVVLLERNLYGHPLAGLLWERQLEKALLEHGWEKVPHWKCFFVNREKDFSCQCMWTRRECQTRKEIVDKYRNMFVSTISAGAKEKLLYSEKLGANISSWSYDMEGLAKKCVERYCELAHRNNSTVIQSRNSML